MHAVSISPYTIKYTTSLFELRQPPPHSPDVPHDGGITLNSADSYHACQPSSLVSVTAYAGRQRGLPLDPSASSQAESSGAAILAAGLCRWFEGRAGGPKSEVHAVIH